MLLPADIFSQTENMLKLYFGYPSHQVISQHLSAGEESWGFLQFDGFCKV